MMKIFFAFSILISAVTFAGEGDQPYTPTKLEWATLYYANSCNIWFQKIPSASWSVFSDPKVPDTIDVFALYADPGYRHAVEQAAETCAKNIKADSAKKGWAWLKVVKSVNPLQENEARKKGDFY